ncbi:MAG TPA: hypothetical protein VFV72_09920, partial [Candidatus Limnocylindrales bacterium]|nr:hypothetical protein [Candidatus Limnocylindrales bacterium]
QIALGDELLVGLNDDTTRQAELVRECARRGQCGAGRESTGSNGAAKLELELAVERRWIVASQLDEQLAR